MLTIACNQISTNSPRRISTNALAPPAVGWVRDHQPVWTLLVVVLLAVLSVPAAWLTRAPDSSPARLAAAAVLLVAGLGGGVARLAGAADPDSRWAVAGLVSAGLLVAVVGGHAITRAVLEVVDRHGELAAESTLPGGSWIGGLERLAVYASLVAGQGEGVALVLVIKALGRYPELRVGQTTTVDRSGVGERFIIGTLTSLLWAAGAAFLVLGSSPVLLD